jgi:hypothetical protein
MVDGFDTAIPQGIGDSVVNLKDLQGSGGCIHDRLFS